MVSELALNRPEIRSYGDNPYSLNVKVCPDKTATKMIHAYKKLLQQIDPYGNFFLDDYPADKEKYFDIVDKRVNYVRDGPYEILVQAGSRHVGENVEEVWKSLAKNETPLTLLESLFAIRQHPSLRHKLAGSPLVVPATEVMYHDTGGWFPCIRLMGDSIFIDLIASFQKERSFRPLTRRI